MNRVSSLLATQRLADTASIEPLENRIAPAAVASINLADLSGANGFKLSGVGNADFTGAVSDAGDVSGDGFADVIVGAYAANEGGADRGAAYVIFGKAGGFDATLALSALDGSNGFKLSGIADFDAAGISVSAAGDVNGDGFADVIVGAYGADEGGIDSGAAYVVFGKATDFSAALALSALDGSNGFKLSGIADSDAAGISVSGAGDVNGDGFADVVVGANEANEGGEGRGAAYVVFGKPDGFGAFLALSALDGSNGFKLSGIADFNVAGASVSAAGDVNGDGFADVIVGAYGADEGGTERGAAYVVFGKAGGFGAALPLSALDGSNGFKLSGVGDSDWTGRSVSGAGDVNGDGFADLIVGANRADEGGNDRGAAYIVFGKASGFGASLALSTLDGSNGFKLSGIADNDYAGISVSGAGDVNGDGFSDLIAGANRADEGGEDRGAAYVVFGKAGGFGASLALSAVDGSNGFKLSGVADNDYAGRSVSGAGDVNGDGFADLIVGAPYADEGGSDRGAAYVIYGFGTADVTIGATGKTATFTDWDGDVVTIKATKGPLTTSQFHLSSPNPLTGGAHLVYVDFTGLTGGVPDGTGLTITAKRGPTGGDGLVNVGTIDGHDIPLGKIVIDGDLQQIEADEGITALTVYSMGQFAGPDVHGALLKSETFGKLGALTVKTDLSGVTIAAETFGAIKALNLDDVTILASGITNPAKTANAMAIKSLTVNGTVRDSQILAGYDSDRAAVNADVTIGAVKVRGQWIASDLVAGATAGTDGLFGTADDALVGGGNAIVAKIASITVTGAAFGTMSDPSDGFGFVAEEIGSFKVGKAKFPLASGARNDTAALLSGVTGDVRVREVV